VRRERERERESFKMVSPFSFFHLLIVENTFGR
jgi:hypothetical protein